MATWVRTATGTQLSATDGAVTGSITLGNGTAPGDFDPAAVTSVRIQFSEKYLSGTFDNDTYTAHQNAMLTYNGVSSGELAAVDEADETIDVDGESFAVDSTDNTPNTLQSVADWEAANLITNDVSGQWIGFNGSKGKDGVTVGVTDVTVTITYTPPPTLTSTHSRFRNDDGPETGTWIAAAQTDPDFTDDDQYFRLRMGLSTDGAFTNKTMRLQFRKNGGSWTDISTTTDITWASSVYFIDGASTTQQLTTGSFRGGVMVESDNDSNAFSAAASGDIEVEWMLWIDSTKAAAGDYYEFRVTSADSGISFVDTEIPRLDVVTLTREQEAFRFRNDDGDEDAATWSALLNTDINLVDGADRTFRLRFVMKGNARHNSNLSDYLQYRKNGGSWQTVTGISTVVQTVASPWIIDNEATTQQLSTGDFNPGYMKESRTARSVGQFLHAGVQRFEVEIVCKLLDAGTTVGDYVEFQFKWENVDPTLTQIPRIDVVASGGTSVQIGHASETDSAQTVTPVKPIVVAIGHASETDTAQTVNGIKTAAITHASETDAAQVVAPVKPIVVAIGHASETDAAQTIFILSPIVEPVGHASETETAQPVAAVKPIVEAVSHAAEVDAAQPVAAVKPIVVAIGAASEAETAQPVAAVKPITVAISHASETDTAQPVIADKPIVVAVGHASETDSAQPADPIKVAPVGHASETDAAQTVTVQLGAEISVPIGHASETDAAQTVTVRQPIVVAVGHASETDTAQAVTAVKPIVTAVTHASETDTAQTVTPAVSAPIVQPVSAATETDSAQVVAPVKPIVQAVGHAAEVDAAQAVAASKIAHIGPAFEFEDQHTFRTTLSVNAGSNLTGIGAQSGLGQSIVAQVSGEVAGIMMSVEKDGAPTDGLQLAIADALNGTVIATSDTLDAADIFTFKTYKTFVFSTPVYLVSGQKYWLQVTRTGAGDAANFYLVWGSSSATEYLEGESTYNNSGTWTNVGLPGRPRFVQIDHFIVPDVVPVKPIITPVTHAAETDSAQQVDPVKPIVVAVGEATDSETAQPVTVRQPQIIAVGHASETDTAIPVGTPGSKAIIHAAETDAAQPVAAVKTVHVGTAYESDDTIRLVTCTNTQSSFAIGTSAIIGGKGQSFTAPKTAPLTSLKFTLGKVGTPIDGLVVSLVDSNLSSPTVYAVSDEVQGTAIGTSPADVEFTFPTPHTVISGQVYYLRVERSGSVDASHYYRIYGASAGSGETYDEGERLTETSGVWQALDPANRPFRLDFTLGNRAVVGAVKPIITPVGEATETDAAQLVTVRTSIVVQIGTAIETDSAQSVAAPKSVAVGVATESESSFGVAPTKTVTIGHASETDAAQNVNVQVAQVIPIGTALEVDTAIPIFKLHPIIRAIGYAAEYETARLIFYDNVPTIAGVTSRDGKLGVTSRAGQLGVTSRPDTHAITIGGNGPAYTDDHV